MSVQFGKCNFDGRPMDPEDLAKVRPVLAQYGPDGEGYICKDNFAVLYRAFHTTKESRREVQPHTLPSGAVLMWDGRLDNGDELIGQLTRDTSATSTDLEIIAAAYERWGTDSFAKLIGDWALSIWNPRTGSLLLAKDFVGTRHLYYSVGNDKVTWCTILDPLVLFEGQSFKLEEEYIAGWLSFFPATHLTPYAGIHAVPPSSFVRLGRGTERVTKYWEFDPANRIRYRTDSEFEEHFRIVFSESVRRRLRSDSPVLAELSGGMDSSSIVCTADELIVRGRAETPRLDTLSYYDDSEPNWDEHPYFTKVEEKRGRAGIHIDVSGHELLKFRADASRFTAAPDTIGTISSAVDELATEMNARGNRVVLSGIGGDEVTGGVPTPLPHLEDLLARGKFIQLARQLKIWALRERRPWFHLLSDAARAFLPSTLVGIAKYKQPAPWLSTGLVKRYSSALTDYEGILRLLGPLPSFQENVNALSMLRRQLGCSSLSARPLCEKRYPFLDRSFLEFLYSIPREQIVRPGQRRSLMRRSLAGVVPDALLSRRRKAFLSRAPLTAVARGWSDLEVMRQDMHSVSLGLVDAERFREAMLMARRGELQFTVAFWRTVALEGWLVNVGSHVMAPHATRHAARTSFEPNKVLS